MRIVELDAAGWTTVGDFLEALKKALGAPKWHGTSYNAMIDSMVYGGINEVELPYEVHVRNSEPAPKDVRDAIELLRLELKGTIELKCL